MEDFKSLTTTKMEEIRKEVWKRRGRDISYNFNLLKHIEDSGVTYVVFPCLKNKLPALTYLKDNVIVISESVYENAANGNAHARFIVAHELGHADLHAGRSLAAYGGILEIEASFYAYELLAPIELVARKVRSPSLLRLLHYANEFGVTRDIMDYQYRTAAKEIATHGKDYHRINLRNRLQEIHSTVH